MMFLARAVLAASLVMLMTVPVRAGEVDRRYQYADVVYTLPEGWRKGRTDDTGFVVLLTDTKAKPMLATLRIYAAFARDRDVEALVEELYASELESKRAELIGTAPPQHTRLNNYDVYMKGFVVNDGGRYLRLYFAFDLMNHVQVYRFETRARNEEQIATAQKLVNDDVVPMLGAMRYISAGATPLLGAPVPGPLDGVYWGGELQMRPGANGAELDFVTYTYTFFPDGRFFDGIPPEGIRAFDYDALVKRYTDDIGNYQIVGSDLHLKFADGVERTISYKDGVVSRGQATLFKAVVPPDGYRFEGNRSTFYYSSISTGLSSTGGVSASSFQAFSKDGTFTGSRHSSASGSYDQGGGFAVGSETPESVGRYEVKDGQLLLTDADGTQRTWEIFILPASKAGDTDDIIVQGQFLKERGKD